MKRSLPISVLAATAVTLLCTSCGGSKVGRAPVRDLVLIYDGGEHRTVKWNAEQFADYVATDGETPEWLFDGFLFLEIHSGTGLSYASGYTPTPARKQDWITLIDKYLTPGHDIAALNECVGTMRERIPGPFHRRKIVLSLPEPIPGQTDWGEIDGRSLDFNDDADRTAACKWYIDLLIERFTAAGLDNLQLCGFYWLAEEATNTRTFVAQVSDYIHEKGLDFYWIPYFKSDGYDQWRELGFDKAYLQPNHFFNDAIPDSRIDETCRLATQAGMSLEMEFDENALQQNGRGSRMKAYIDSYERNGIFDNNDLAYYQGNNAFSLLRHGTAEDRALYERLASIIARRQKEFYGKR